ncbi:hypothetical protein C6341_g26627 [Phytophthora cactorum]|nr:hypothetical protein PC120_g26489 [Phytophthora cactorum]KAG3123240.1 hypothetical protein C6341_g26627 [Phytophthora cactorum]
MCCTFSAVVGFGVDLITDDAWGLVAVACGILVWTVTEPLRSMVRRGRNIGKVSGVCCTSGWTLCMRIVEFKRTGSRAWFVLRVCWTVATLEAYATFYGVLFVYDIIEGACLGWPGVVILTLTMNYLFVDRGGVMKVGGVALDRGTVILDAGVLALGVASHV